MKKILVIAITLAFVLSLSSVFADSGNENGYSKAAQHATKSVSLNAERQSKNSKVCQYNNDCPYKDGQCVKDGTCNYYDGTHHNKNKHFNSNQNKSHHNRFGHKQNR